MQESILLKYNKTILNSKCLRRGEELHKSKHRCEEIIESQKQRDEVKKLSLCLTKHQAKMACWGKEVYLHGFIVVYFMTMPVSWQFSRNVEW
jgi:hypothetical protein